MPQPVFLSYAREGSRAHVGALRDALEGEGVPAFLDTEDVPVGGAFPERLADALLDARVVVVFLEPRYFTRPFCRLEFQLATEPARRGLDDGSRHLVVALPAEGAPPVPAEDLDALPRAARRVSWPAASETARLVALVRERLAGESASVGESLDRAMGGRAAARTLFAERAEVPPPLRLGPMPVVTPPGLRGSLRERFVGRDDDLWRLHQALAPVDQRHGHAALTAAVRGMGGVGKTQLAAEYFYRYGPRHYTGGLFWLDAKRDVAEQHHAVLRKLDPTWTAELTELRRQFGESELEARLAERLADALHRVPGAAPILFVVDDVPDAPAGGVEAPSATRGRHLLDSWCPAPDAAACLATARGVVGFQEEHAVERQELDLLDDRAAVALLTSGAVDPTALTNEEWRDLAAWAGRLPLALALLARAMESGVPSLQPRAILDTARERPHDRIAAIEEVHRVVQSSGLGGALRGMKAAYRLSYEALPDDAQTALRRLACLAPEPLPVPLVVALGPECADPAVQGMLLGRSFVAPPTRRAAAGVPVLGTMHVMIAQVARALAGDLTSDLEAVVSALASAFTEDRARDPRAWELLSACLPHAEAALHLVDATAESATVSLRERAIGVRIALGALAHAQGAYARAGAASADALAQAERLLGPEHPAALHGALNLAATLRATGDFDRARTLLDRVVEARGRILGPEDPATIEALNNLAEVHLAARDIDAAAALLQRVTETSERVLGPEHPTTLASLNNLAEASSARGDVERAHALYERVLEVRTRLLGPEHPDTLTSANNLAYTRHLRGDVDGASALYEHVLEVRTRLLGPEHPSTLRSMHNLGFVRRKTDEVAARDLLQRAYAGRRRLLGDAHPETRRTREILRRFLRAVDDTAAAEALEASGPGAPAE
jgi:tetratricopeptide (TPR) repeat protein